MSETRVFERSGNGGIEAGSKPFSKLFQISACFVRGFPDRHGPRRARAPGDQRAHPLPAPESPGVHRSPQIPAAARMPGIKSSTCVQVALVEFPRAGRGRWARGGTPTAIGIGGINSSASVQVAPVVILAARLGIARAYVPRHRDHSHRQHGQELEDSKAHHCLSLCRGPSN